MRTRVRMQLPKPQRIQLWSTEDASRGASEKRTSRSFSMTFPRVSPRSPVGGTRTQGKGASEGDVDAVQDKWDVLSWDASREAPYVSDAGRLCFKKRKQFVGILLYSLSVICICTLLMLNFFWMNYSVTQNMTVIMFNDNLLLFKWAEHKCRYLPLSLTLSGPSVTVSAGK